MKTQNKPVVDPDEMFPSVEKMIYDQCWKTAKAYPISFDECKSEAYMAFVKSCYDYNPAKGTKFTTWCYFWVWTKLKDLVMKRSADPIQFHEMNEEMVGEAPPTVSDSLELIPTFSQEAQEIIHYLLESPGEVLGHSTCSGQRFLAKVKAYLITKKGRDKQTVERAHQEIVMKFSAAWTGTEPQWCGANW